MYKLFETEFGTPMIRAEEKIRAVEADATAAVLLRVPRDTPLLCVERVAFSLWRKAGRIPPRLLSNRPALLPQ